MHRIQYALLYAPGDAPPSGPRAAALLRGAGIAVQGEEWPLSLARDGVSVDIDHLDPPGVDDLRVMMELHQARALLSEADQDRVKRCDKALFVQISFEELIPMEGVHTGLRLVASLLDGPLAILDGDAARLVSAGWARGVASSPVPPNPESLVTVHAVTDGDAPIWMHTHGLARFGIPEIELPGVDPSLDHEFGYIVKGVAARLLIDGLPAPGQAVEWASGFTAALMRWDLVHRDLAPGLGGPDDRDDLHTMDNLVLVRRVRKLVQERSGWVSAATLGPSLPEHVMLYRTDWETERLEALSRLRWGLFAMLHDTLGSSDGYLFLAKFGYDGPGQDGFREHLWFRVQEATQDACVGELINEPHQDLGMHVGQVGTHSTDRLTDFSVMSALGTFDAETLTQLVAALSTDGSSGPG